jgi:8-oxo-dGDP phosphatase
MYDGMVCSVRVDDVVMPDGSTARREVVEHDEAVAIVALDDDDRVILIEQYRHPMRRRLWELPAGLMDLDGEPADRTAARELLEETGFAAREWSVLLDVATSPGFTDETVRIFLARDLTNVGRPADAEHEESQLRVVRVPLDAAVDAVFRGDVVNVMAVAGVLAAERVVRAGAQDRSVSAPALRGHSAELHQAEIGRAPDLPGPVEA